MEMCVVKGNEGAKIAPSHCHVAKLWPKIDVILIHSTLSITTDFKHQLSRFLILVWWGRYDP